MMIVLVFAGIGAILAGVVAILYGVALELSLGNSLIVAGTVGASSGLLLLGLAMVLRELKIIARRLAALAVGEGRARSQSRPGVEEEDFGFDQPLPADRSRGESTAASPSYPPSPSWPEEMAPRSRVDEPPEPSSAARPRRNLLFASASRKERERAQSRSAESMPADPLGPPLAADPGEAPPANLQDTWLKMDRARPSAPPPLRRSGRAPPALAEANAEAAARAAEPPGVTVLKSGVVDGMAYSLYSDGSIEAQMPEGMMRFASLDELTAHIERRA